MPSPSFVRNSNWSSKAPLPSAECIVCSRNRRSQGSSFAIPHAFSKNRKMRRRNLRKNAKILQEMSRTPRLDRWRMCCMCSLLYFEPAIRTSRQESSRRHRRQSISVRQNFLVDMHSLFRVKDSRKTDAAQTAAPGSSVTRYINCRLLIGHELRTGQDLWVRDGSVADPKQLFWEGRSADTTIDCKGRILAPGFIDLQVLAHAPPSALLRPCCQALRSDARRASACRAASLLRTAAQRRLRRGLLHPRAGARGRAAPLRAPARRVWSDRLLAHGKHASVLCHPDCTLIASNCL